MGIYLNPGNTLFKQTLNSKFYVDKSELIAYTNSVLNTNEQYICVSRPRRFGKSVTANMLSAYYSKECNSKHLFDSLKIASNPSYEKHLNRYDVIFLNMQNILTKAKHPENMLELLNRKVLQDLKNVYTENINYSENDLIDVMEQIFDRYNASFVFIIDEWDCIFRVKNTTSDFQKQYLDFLRSLLKDQSYVKLVYMTGILPIKKYGIHSALNMFYEYSMIDPEGMEQYIGFTEDEVMQLCEQYGMDFEETKRWYDGYQVSENLNIYNPKSVVDAIIHKKFKSYWNRTETYEALKIYIEMNMDGLKDAVISMMAGEEIAINADTFANDMTSMKNRDDVLTLLVHLGYLTYNPETQKVHIPNEEIRGEFYNAVTNMNWN